MDQATLRLMDANFNRAREAVRVLEDYARFILDDRELSGAAKGLRHGLREALAPIAAADLLSARDTPEDVGTTITTASEQTRAEAYDVAIAAGKRLSEALRCIEEYGKIIDPAIAAAVEAMRYRAYEVEKRILAAGDRAARFAAVRLYVLLTEEYCQRPVLEVCQAALAGGADCIQLREKGLSDDALLQRAREVAALCHEAGALFIMNDRVDLALLSGADGVHLGQEDLSTAQARKIAGGRLITGKSTHNRDEAQAALADKPDYIAFGAVFASPTKPDVATAGVDGLRQIVALSDRPVVAIGGITPETAGQARQAEASAVAVCQAVIAANDPRAAAAALKAVL